jgi:rubrerythrin
MSNELAELLDTAIYKEIASQAFYIAGQSRTEDPGAKVLMKELAEEELKHSQLLKDIKEKGLNDRSWHRNEVPNLRISEYLTGSETLEGAGLQDTLILAMKREQQSIEFYSRLMSVMKDEAAKRMCERLVHEELRHKLRLEIFYDNFFYGED